MLSTLSVKRSLPPGMLSSTVLPGLSSSSRVNSKKVSCRMCRTSLYKVSTPGSAVSAERSNRVASPRYPTYREATSKDRPVLCCQVRSVVALVYGAGATLLLPLLLRPARIEKRKQASHCSKSFLRAASFIGLPKSGNNGMDNGQRCSARAYFTSGEIQDMDTCSIVLPLCGAEVGALQFAPRDPTNLQGMKTAGSDDGHAMVLEEQIMGCNKGLFTMGMRYQVW